MYCLNVITMNKFNINDKVVILKTFFNEHVVGNITSINYIMGTYDYRVYDNTLKETYYAHEDNLILFEIWCKTRIL